MAEVRKDMVVLTMTTQEYSSLLVKLNKLQAISTSVQQGKLSINFLTTGVTIYINSIKKTLGM